MTTVIDSESGDLLHTTAETARYVKTKLRPWIKIDSGEQELSDEDMAALWLKEYGNNIATTTENSR
jgi:hypothetical protein